MSGQGLYFSLADAQEFARRGMAAQADVDALTGKQGCNAATESVISPLTKLRAAKQPNKTEAEFGRILEAMKLRGEIADYRYEGITLKWADMRYTPDWLVFYQASWSDKGAPLAIKIIEVKGAHIWDRDLVRFKGARAAWPMFDFEMHQKKAGEWRRIH